MTPPRDIYGRRPTSQSRGKTHDRIMQLQHAPGTLPGGDEVLADAPAGSIGEALLTFHRQWVEHQSVTSRRAYERSIVLLARDLAERGPKPGEPSTLVDAKRLAAHLDWRVANGLDHAGELQRAGAHLARLGEWMDAEHGTTLGPLRETLRAHVYELIEGSDAG